jgi:hypothetical protein
MACCAATHGHRVRGCGPCSGLYANTYKLLVADKHRYVGVTDKLSGSWPRPTTVVACSDLSTAGETAFVWLCAGMMLHYSR